MDDVDNKIVGRYSELLKETEYLEKKDLSLTNKQFEQLYEVFGSSLGKTLTSKDYMNLFSSTQIENFINTANTLQQKYLRLDNNDITKIVQSTHSVTEEPKRDKETIPFSDLIAIDIDSNGEFKGLRIRSDIAKVLFV